MIKILVNILRGISNTFKSMAYYLDIYMNSFNEKNVKITVVELNDNNRYLSFEMTNTRLLDSKNVLRSIYNTLMSNEEFLNFGSKKVIIVTGLMGDYSFNYHHNILITNDTPFNIYYNKVKDIINTHYQDGYKVDRVPKFKISVWNMDHLANKNIKLTKSAVKGHNVNKIGIRTYHSYNVIKPLKTNITILSCGDNLTTIDLETIRFKAIKHQIPISISLSYGEGDYKLFLIELPKMRNVDSMEKAVDNLWLNFFDFIQNNINMFKHIFALNLGSFDGYLIYKALSNVVDPTQISCLMDDDNNFIRIVWKSKYGVITWKDAYRIFPVGLDELCQMFEVEGKLSEYNPKFNDLDMFNDETLLTKFKQYAIQDSQALFKSLVKAQKIYLTDYNVDITSILSTSTLSLKIFRQHFLDVDIPILKGTDDHFIRQGYFGGHTDYYKGYICKCYYYDVNSLYPFAMCKPMPHKLVTKYNDMTDIKLENFFGFCLAEITTPKNILKPLLPYKHEGKVIYPTGT